MKEYLKESGLYYDENEMYCDLFFQNRLKWCLKLAKQQFPATQENSYSEEVLIKTEKDKKGIFFKRTKSENENEENAQKYL